MGTTTKTPAPAWARAMGKFNDYMSQDFLGGPRWLKFAWFINVQKAGTGPFVLALMVIYDNFSPAALTYLALHGTYGVCWLLKDMVFPDPNWQRRITLGGGLNTWLFVLGPYWVAPILLITPILGANAPTPSAWVMTLAIIFHTLGVVTMMGADTQKYFVLKARRGLITDGWFGRVRHPNYTGEMMLYGSYALLVGHWIPWAILAWVWLGVFLPNMLLKEESMSRYPEWEAYKARTGMLLPRLFPSRGSEGVTVSPTA